MSWQDVSRATYINKSLEYPEKISPHILQNISKSQALKKQFEFSSEEFEVSGGSADPIGDEKMSKGNGIIHRYQNRILYTPTQACPVNCRYCFRKNELNKGFKFFSANLESLKTYLRKHPEVEEVILTGGDPLILSDQNLEKIFKICLEENIKFIRIHTRTPIAIPERINDDFRNLIKKYQEKFCRIFFVLHCNHKDELTWEVKKSLDSLQSLKISLLTQSVLLKGVNDCELILKDLFENLVKLGFNPYYLHHPDKVKGAMHFYLSQDEGMRIYSALRQIVSGWAVPHYIIDSPSASGKKLLVNQDI